MTPDFEFPEFTYKGKSAGRVDDCGFCEHCYDLSEGVDWFDAGGVSWCASCLACNNDAFYDPRLDVIFDSDSVYDWNWHEDIVCLGEI